MPYIVSFITSASVSFLAHHFAERKLSKGWTKDVRLVFRNYHIHHSFFSALIIAIAFIVTGGIVTFIFIGYGIGSMWQHKFTHNQQSEKGMVFITKIKD